MSTTENTLRRLGQTTFSPLDESSVRLMRETLFAMFSEVTELDQWPPAPDGQPLLAGAIKLNIREFSVIVAQPVVVAITYEVELFEPRQGRVYQWTLHGTRAMKHEIMAIQASVGKATVSEMKDAMASFMVGFREEAAVQEWLAAQCLTTQ